MIENLNFKLDAAISVSYVEFWLNLEYKNLEKTNENYWR